MPPRFQFFKRRGKPLIQGEVKKTKPRVWKFLTDLAKASFAVKFVTKVTQAVKKAIQPEAVEAERKVKQLLKSIPEKDLPIRDIERDDIVDAIRIIDTPRGFAVGVPEGVIGSRSGAELSSLMEEMESLGKVKEITPQSRAHFVKRGFIIPKGAKYLVLPPKATFGVVFDQMNNSIKGRAAAIGVTVSKVMSQRLGT